jgi:NAD(P)-dependent dehydrogenase (short-subunit alcohol dehydrogenase family)
MPYDFTNQTILVPGGTGGLGRAVALAFIASGATVVVPYRKPEEFAALQSAANSPNLSGQQADLTSAESVDALIATTIAAHKKIDAVINCVGGYAGGTKLWETTPETFEQQLSLNLRAAFLLARAAVPTMLPHRSGVLINIASQAAVNHAAGASAYAASKAAVLALFDVLAADLAGTGLRANSILPSIIDTPANRHAMPTANFATWPTPEEIANVILFLCSPDAVLIHGAAIPVYGNK